MNMVQVGETSIQKPLLEALHKLVAVLILTGDGTILDANAVFSSLSGYAPEELQGMPHRLLHDALEGKTEKDAAEWMLVHPGEHDPGLYRYTGRSGRRFWLDVVESPFIGADGGQRILWLGLDVTQRMSAEAEHKALVEALDRSCIAAMYTPDGRLSTVNGNFTAALGYAVQAIKGMTYHEIPANRPCNPETLASMWEHVRAGHAVGAMLHWLSADERSVWLDTTYTPVVGEDGEVEKVIQIAFDVTGKLAKQGWGATAPSVVADAMDASDYAVMVTDATERVLYTNRAFMDMFGYSYEEIGEGVPDMMFGPLTAKLRTEIVETLASGKAFHGEEIAYRKDGRRLWVALHANRVVDAIGTHVRTISVLVDVTDRKLHENIQSKALEGMACNMSREQVLNIMRVELERVLPGLCVTFFEGDIQSGFSRLGQSALPLDSLHEHRRFGGRSEDEETEHTGPHREHSVFKAGYPEHVLQAFQVKKIDGALYHPVIASRGSQLGLVAFYYGQAPGGERFVRNLIDATSRVCGIVMEHEHNKKKVHRLELYDALTDLPNRALLLSNGQRLVREDDARKLQGLAVFYINIDRFSNIIREYSHNGANSVLKTVARRLLVKQQAGECLGRIAGDEFVVIVPECTAAQARKRARLLQKELSKPCKVDGREIPLTVSIGISMWPDNGTDLDLLLTYASESLVQNKHKGIGIVSFFNENLDELSRARFSLETRLRRALDDGALHLQYQPQVYIKTGRLYGVEALCRWHDPDYGPIGPDQFIPLAEESGLIGKLSDWALQESCRQLAAWRSKGLDVPVISVNLSAPNFRDEHLPERILHYLAMSGLGTGDIMLELTERVVVDDDPVVMQTIYKAHAMGLTLSLDDFGTGYSSLSYLRNLPLSEIKLDKSFVQDLHAKEVSRRISQSVLYVGESLNLTVLAEGVETFEQYALLKKQQCPVAQGYLIARPLNADAFEGWVQEWGAHAIFDQYLLM